MIMEEPVSVNAGRYSPSAPPAVRDVNISVGAGFGTSSASVSGQSGGAGFGTSSASAVGQLPVGAGFGTSSAPGSGQPGGAGFGTSSASASGHGGSTGQLERSYLRSCPGTVVFKCYVL